MTDHHHDHQDHPLTDKFLAENYSPFFVIDIEEFVYCSRDMRALADWQLEQVSKWLDDNVGMLLLCAEPGVGDRYLESLKDEFIQSFIETMRPQQQEES